MFQYGKNAVLGFVLLACAFTACIERKKTSASYADWLTYKETVARDSALLRYHTFEKDKEGGLIFTPSGEPPESFTQIEGRWPQKKAVRLDRSFFVGEPFDLVNKSFTVAAWFRVNGMGSIKGNPITTGGTLFSVGTGYWDGWRLTYKYPEQAIGFEIGRPKPSHSVGIRTGPVSDRVWHHLAATWDGRQMRIYVDGLLAASGEYAGDYTQGDKFRVGFAGSGWGSVVLDVDELVVYKRSLTAKEIMRTIYLGSSIADSIAAGFQAAQDAASKKDFRKAAEEYLKIMDTPGVLESHVKAAGNALRQMAGKAGTVLSTRAYERILAMADTTLRERLNVRLSLGHSRIAAKDFDGARKEYAAIVTSPDAPGHFKSHAQLCIAESFVRQRNFTAAKVEFAKVATILDAPAHHKQEAQERIKEVERLEAGQPPRDPAWSRVVLPTKPVFGKEFYLSPTGSDTNPGTRERPFATLERAREAIRELKFKGGLPKGGVAVYIAAGEYPRKETFKLSTEDSGTAESPIYYCACEGGKVRFTGGVHITGFKPVPDASILARLPEESRKNVMQTDLKAQGITDFGEVRPSGFAMGEHPAPELFFNGKPMPLARWPNEGFVRVVKVIDQGATKPLRGAVFEYDGDRPARWLSARDVWLFGYWRYYWADGRLDVSAIDPKTRQIKTGRPYTYGGGIKEGMPYFAYNLLEEIDIPGEWYLDRASGILYFYPPSEPGKATIEFSMLSSPMVEMDGVSYVTLLGLTFELGRSSGIVIKGGDHCLIAGCVICRMGGDGVIIDGGANHGIFGCDIHTMGRGGTRIKGGDRKTLTPGGHFVENCHIYDFSRINRTYTPAVHLDGVGNRIAHNLFHHSPGHAMRIEGNDHIVEFNEIHHVVTESDDQGGLDIFFNPTYRGNIFRYNYWHDIGGREDLPCGQAGIRLDDAISGVLIYGNIFSRCSSALFGGVQIHGGKENIVDNNIFLYCKYAISFSPWGAERWKQFLANERVVKETTQTVDIRRPPYSTRYPALARLAENPDVNMVWRNLVYKCGEFLTRDRGQQEIMDNYIITRDPGLTGAGQWGFRPIPFDEIGPYPHPLRVSWPIAR